MQILNGKTNHDNLLYGRAFRHRNVNLCSQGSLGFMLMARFHVTKEFDGENCPDFRDNSSWYDIKLVVSLASGQRNEQGHVRYLKTMGITNYYNAVKDIIRSQGLVSNHYCHLGRVLGAAELQMVEMDDDHIRKLGNWGVTVIDQSYSTKLPMAAMRAAGGYTDSQGMFYCPRSTVEVPDELKKKIFPFADNQLRLVEEEVEKNGEKEGGNYLGAARLFLRMLIRLRTIILQDAAAMFVSHPDRVNCHHFFQEFPEIFQTREFDVSFEKIV